MLPELSPRLNVSTSLPCPVSVWCMGLACIQWDSRPQALAMFTCVSMPLVTAVTAGPQLPDLLRQWTSQTLKACLPSQPRPRGSSLWPDTGSLVGDIIRHFTQRLPEDSIMIQPEGTPATYMHTEQTLHTYIPASTAHTLQTPLPQSLLPPTLSKHCKHTGTTQETLHTYTLSRHTPRQ